MKSYQHNIMQLLFKISIILWNSILYNANFLLPTVAAYCLLCSQIWACVEKNKKEWCVDWFTLEQSIKQKTRDPWATLLTGENSSNQ